MADAVERRIEAEVRADERRVVLAELERWCAEQANAEADICKQRTDAKERTTFYAAIGAYRAVQEHLASLVEETK